MIYERFSLFEDHIKWSYVWIHGSFVRPLEMWQTFTSPFWKLIQNCVKEIFPFFYFQNVAKWITVSHNNAGRFKIDAFIMEFSCAVETTAKQFLVRFFRWLSNRSSHWYQQVFIPPKTSEIMLIPLNWTTFLFHRTLLGDSQRHLYDSYKRAYAEMLYRWNLLSPRAKVLKYISVPAEAYRDVEFVAECSSCMKVTRAPVCKECHSALLKCSLCRLPVKGLANACLSCGHGGHSDHMKKWFSVSSWTPWQIRRLDACFR